MNEKSTELDAGDRLKACPFCGGYAESNSVDRESEGADEIRCEKCGARTDWHANTQEAEKAWNRRVPEQQPKLQSLGEHQADERVATRGD